MSDEAAPRLRPDLWVRAVVRLCGSRDLPAFIVKRGDPDAGAVLLKLNRLEHGSVVLTQSRDMAGNMVWIRASGDDPVPDADAETLVQRQIARDPDLWVIEIEDRQGRHPIDDWPAPPER